MARWNMGLSLLEGNVLSTLQFHPGLFAKKHVKPQPKFDPAKLNQQEVTAPDF